MEAPLWQFSQIKFLLSTKFSPGVTSDAMTNHMKIISLDFYGWKHFIPASFVSLLQENSSD